MGMSNRIGRTVIENDCNCVIVNRKNEIKHELVKIYGKYDTMDGLQNAVRRKLKNNRAVVQSVETHKYYASMTAEEFINNASKITKLERKE